MIFDEGSIQQTAERLLRRTSLRPRLGIVLGSGFGGALDLALPAVQMDFSELDHFHATTVPGHEGKLVIGHHKRLPVLLLKGRTHFYEGFPLPLIAHPIRVLAAFGIRDLVLTNAAGGIHRSLKPGDFMAITDHLNFMGENPLRGMRGDAGFLDLTDAYSPELLRMLIKAADQARVRLRKGVYLAVSGPSYETPAEIRAFERLGADAVGMSTVPEVIVARQCGMRVAAISCITNLAAGRNRGKISHDEVLKNAGKQEEKARRLLVSFMALYSKALT